jgi:hypothetical protein
MENRVMEAKEIYKKDAPTFIDIFPLGRKKKKVSGRFGIEIEAETSGLSSYNGILEIDQENNDFLIKNENTYWKPLKDNSLRNFGVEFVLKAPLEFDGVVDALEDFKKIFDGVNFIQNSPSTSVHVHMNIQDLPLKKIANIACTWLLFENLLIEFSGESRRTNLFCLPMRCAEHNLKAWMTLFDYFSNRKTGWYFDEDNYKYSAINLCTLTVLGSLEFRSFRGETNTDKILEWVTILNSIFEFSMSIDTPKDLIDMIDLGYEELLRRVFPASYHLLEASTKGIPLESFIKRNIFYVAVLYDSVPDWDVLDAPMKVSKQDQVSVYGAAEQMAQFLNQPIPGVNPQTLNTIVTEDFEEGAAEQMAQFLNQPIPGVNPQTLNTPVTEDFEEFAIPDDDDIPMEDED